MFQDLRDEVNAMISPDVVSSLNQSIVGEAGEDEGVEFALAHLKNPELDMRNAAEVDGEDDEEEEDLPMISFTIEGVQDQLY